jgi:CRP/FNR family cyclic AMP-dependent transcriptional regulator
MLRRMALTDASALRLFLRKVPVFSGLEGRSLESVMSMLREQTFEPGSVIFAEGELGRTMHVIHRGEVEVLHGASSGREVAIIKLGPGECFGEMALVELGPRSAKVVAKRNTTVLSLNNFDLYKLFREDNYAFVIVLQNICRLLSRRLRKADSRLAELLSRAPTLEAEPKAPSKPSPKRRRGLRKPAAK